MKADRRLRVIQFPYANNNPYQELLVGGMKKYGIDVDFQRRGSFGLVKSLLFEKVDVLHLHWLTTALHSKSIVKCLAKLCALYVTLLLYRATGKRVIWTVHNLVNHEKQRVGLDLFNSRLVARLAHALLVHGESAAPLVASSYRVSPSKIHVVYHGNYRGVISAAPPSREHKGIRFLFFGLIKPYKGVPELIREFRKLDKENFLHVAGMAREPTLRQDIEMACAHAPNIKLQFEYVADDVLQGLLAWADVIVLPFKDVLSSGSLLMALTAGRPVIAPRAGLIPEYLDGNCGFLYEPDDPTALFQALQAAVTCSDLPQKALGAKAQGELFDWERIGADIYRIYQNPN